MRIAFGNGRLRTVLVAMTLLVLVGGWNLWAEGAAEEGEYPSRNIEVVVPTGEGGAADRVVQALSNVWRDYLGVEFERSFYPGASGEVGYTTFLRTEPDGHTILSGNIGPEMIMYGLQDPDYNFPEDYLYFGSVAVDPAVIWVAADSPFETIQDLVEEARERTVTISTSRMPHPATVGALALAEATGADFSIVPYGGGSPARTAGLTREVDAVTTHVGSSLDLAEDIRFLVMFQSENQWPELSDNAPTANDAFDIDLPDLGATRAFGVHREFKENYPERYEVLTGTFREAFEDPRFAEEFEAVGFDSTFLSYKGEEASMDVAERMLDLVSTYRGLLEGEN